MLHVSFDQSVSDFDSRIYHNITNINVGFNIRKDDMFAIFL